MQGEIVEPSPPGIAEPGTHSQGLQTHAWKPPRGPGLGHMVLKRSQAVLCVLQLFHINLRYHASNRCHESTERAQALHLVLELRLCLGCLLLPPWQGQKSQVLRLRVWHTRQVRASVSLRPRYNGLQFFDPTCASTHGHAAMHGGSHVRRFEDPCDDPRKRTAAQVLLQSRDFGLVHGIGLDIPSGSSEAYRSMANLHDCDDVSKLVELCCVHFAVQCLLEPGQAEHELK